jgi:hypothetical protein
METNPEITRLNARIAELEKQLRISPQLLNLLADLEKSRFYGTVEIAYQAGIAGHAGVLRRYKFNATDGSATANQEN